MIKDMSNKKIIGCKIILISGDMDNSNQILSNLKKNLSVLNFSTSKEPEFKLNIGIIYLFN